MLAGVSRVGLATLGQTGVEPVLTLETNLRQTEPQEEFTARSQVVPQTDCREICTGPGIGTVCAGQLSDPDLATVITAWASLPETIRTAILMLVRSSAGADAGRGGKP